MKEKSKEKNIFDYINWRSDLSFNQDSLNKVDILMLSMLSLLDFDGVINNDLVNLKTASDKLFKGKKAKDLELGLIIPKTIFLMFKNMSLSNRWKDIFLSDYINDISIDDNEQISALTFHINDNIIITFSGTDDTIIGWKENFMMIYDKEVPSEKKAVDYLNNIALKYSDKKIYIAGHSKGGHLAVYSAVNAKKEVKNRIEHVYSFDGPGQNEVEVKKILLDNMESKITTIIPQASTVGRLFNHLEEVKIIYSTQTSFFQHDPYSWCIMGNDFVYTTDENIDSINLNNKINEVLLGMSIDERRQMVESLYELLSYNDTKSLTSLYKKRNTLFSIYLKMPKIKRDSIFKPFYKLLKDKSAQKTIFETIRIYVMESKRTHEFDKLLDTKLNTDNE